MTLGQLPVGVTRVSIISLNKSFYPVINFVLFLVRVTIVKPERKHAFVFLLYHTFNVVLVLSLLFELNA